MLGAPGGGVELTHGLFNDAQVNVENVGITPPHVRRE